MHGVYHRNIKPHVLYVDMQGVIKVTSLFLARLDEFATVSGGNDELTRLGQVMGTAEYMAPEQAMDAKHADGRADIYALGCTLYFLLSGRPPYGGSSMMDKIAYHKTKPIPSLTSVGSDVPHRVDRAFQRMMAKEPAGRYPFMGDVVTALEQKRTESIISRLFRWFAPSSSNIAG
jgi:serine/threonine protein kinase